MNGQTKQVPLGRAVLCVLLCVIFASLSTYQFCYYSIFSAHKQAMGETTTAMKEKYDLLLAARDAQIAELTARLQTTEEEKAVAWAEVDVLTERLVAITGLKEGTAEDCLRLLLTRALTEQDRYAGASGSDYVAQEVEAYMATYAADFVSVAERLLFIDFLYRTNYLHTPPTPEQAEEAMVEGYIQAAGDVYAVYYTAEEYLAFTDRMNASLRCGIGAVSMKAPDGQAMLVLHVHEKSPAKAAGMQAGDRIIGADGKLMADVGYDAVAAMIPGKQDTSVTLTVERGGEVLTFVVARRTVETDVLISRVYEEGGKRLGYVRLLAFNNRTAERLEETLADMQRTGVEGLIFDLRDNTGGSLSSILDVLDVILPENKLVISFDYKNKNNAREPIYTETAASVSLPIVVLQNRSTASAAELFGAALRDHGYATLVGETSFGKGTMQTGYKLENGAYITVTVAGYLPPSGESYHKVGIRPDVEAPVSEKYENQTIYLLPFEEDTPLQTALSLLGGAQE